MSLKARVDRLWKESGASDRAAEERHWLRRHRELKTTLLHFLAAMPTEWDGNRVWATIAGREEWLDGIVLGQCRVPEDAPFIARVVRGFDYHGWFPSPLPAAWVELAFSLPDGDVYQHCEDCGLPHPGEPTYLGPVYRPAVAVVDDCLHCGGTVSGLGYFRKHNARWPTPTALGEFLLKGGDPNDFDPLRKAK